MPNFWKSTNGIITIVGIGLVVVALIGVALYFAFGKEEKKPDNSKNNEEQQEQNAQTPNGQEVNVGKGNSVPTNTRTINNFGGSSYNSRSNSPINNGTSLTPRLSSMATMSNIKVNNTTSNNNNINRTNNSNRANNRVASRRPIANPLQQNQNNNLGNNPINNGNPPAGFGGANNNINNNNLLNNQNNNNLINNENNNINNNEIEDEGGNEEGNNNPQFPFNLPLNPGMGGIGNDIGEGAGGEGEGEGLPIENPPEEAMQQENINEAPQEPKKQGAQRLNTAVEKAVRRILLQKSVKKWLNQASALKAKHLKDSRLLEQNEFKFSLSLSRQVRIAIRNKFYCKTSKISEQIMREYFKHTKSTDKEWKRVKQADDKISFYKYFFDLFDNATSVEEKNLLYSTVNAVCSDKNIPVTDWIDMLKVSIIKNEDKMNEDLLCRAFGKRCDFNIKDSPFIKKTRPHIVLGMLDVQVKAKIDETKKSKEAPKLNFHLVIDPVKVEQKFFKSKNNPSLSLQALALDDPKEIGK